MWLPRVSVLLLLGIALFSCHATANNTTFVSTSRTKLRILGVFGHLGKSHFDVFAPLLEELARRGHQVTVVSHYPRSEEAKAREPLPSYEDISLRAEDVGLFLNVVDLTKTDHSTFRVVSEVRNLRYMASLACENGLRHPNMMELVNSGRKFDLVLTEAFNTNCFLAVVNKFKVPYLLLSSHQVMPWANNQFGNPQEASYVPTIFQGLQRPLTFFSRLINVATITFVTKAYDIWYHSVDQALVNELYGPDTPDLKEVARNASALMINTHYSLHGSRPFLPNVLEVGGLHIPRKTSPLPKDIAQFLDNAREGLLYFNLGSMVKASSMPKETLETIMKVLAAIPRKVIWKWEADTLPYQLDNVMVRKWLPQFDILSHPNVRCYLGHGGLLGLSEGIHAGVPMVLIPIFGDQFHNAAAAENRGAALVLRFNELDEHTFRHALDEVFNNTRYRENARKLSKAYRDRPASPLETAVWWTEYIARGNGLPYLKSEGANLPWYQRHLVDVGLFLLALSLALLYTVRRLVELLLSRLLAAAGRPKSSAERKKSKKRD